MNHRRLLTKLLGSAIALAIFAGNLLAQGVPAQDDLPTREESAMQAAVNRVAPSVVRIETLGGLETVGDLLVGTGPTTGLIVSSDGYIVSSAFNFVQKPTQILVDLADGTRLPATVAARDDSRMIVLLKVPTDKLTDAKKQLPVPEAAPVKEMKVGQWAIALGRVYEGDQTNISVGILSAVNRVWGKAIQTDAKISPSNYGGPLVDLEGRVLGVLVPMSPMETGEIAGVEWYDSGIGFAVPLEHINRVLDRLKKGEDLHPGLLGVSMRGSDPFAEPPIIAICHPKSPAVEAGLKPDDRIAEIDGVKVDSLSQMKHQLSPRYAGEKVALVVIRGKDRVETSAELTDKLQPYIHPFLGILPRHDEDLNKSAASDVNPSDSGTPSNAHDQTEPDSPRFHRGFGVTVRDVYPGSPAAKAGIQSGDRIVSVNGQSVKGRLGLQEQIAALEPRQEVKVGVDRAGASQTFDVKLATLPEAVPEKLSSAHKSDLPADENAAATGKIEIKIPEAPNACLAYVPTNYNSHIPYGLVVWLHPAGGYKPDDLIAAWKPLCEANDLILLAPKSIDQGHWQRTELEFIRKAIDDVLQKYNIDRARIVTAGEAAGGSVAYLVASQNRELIRGVAAINAPMPLGMRPPESDPVQRLAILTTLAKKSPPAIIAGIKQLREAKHPVTELDLGETTRSLNDDEMKQLARWIDTLDRS
jgi:serine protease Do